MSTFPVSSVSTVSPFRPIRAAMLPASAPASNAVSVNPTYSSPLIPASNIIVPNTLPTGTPIPTVDGIPAPDPEIRGALQILATTQNNPADEAYLQKMGVNIIFHNGHEALDVIRQHGAQVVFAPTDDPSIHAEWDALNNRMIVNEKYRGNMNPTVLSGIAAAIYHEAGHMARLGDNNSSIQEELDCLALNTMAYRANFSRYPQYQATSPNDPQRALFENGVALYDKLFFDPDPYKRALVNRVIEKYGMLMPESPDHPIPNVSPALGITSLVLYELQCRNAQALQNAAMQQQTGPG